MCAERKKRRGPSGIPCSPAWTQTMYRPDAMNATSPATPTMRWSTRKPMSISRRGPLALADDELQPGPDFAHWAHLDVHEAERQGDLADRVLGDVSLELGGLLRPGNPHEAALLQALAKPGEVLFEARTPGGKNVHGAQRAHRTRNDAHAAGQLAEPGAIFRRRVDRHQRHRRRDAELFRERRARMACRHRRLVRGPEAHRAPHLVERALAHSLDAFSQHVAPEDVAVEVGIELARLGVR